jgi:hypothetical protein
MARATSAGGRSPFRRSGLRQTVLLGTVAVALLVLGTLTYAGLTPWVSSSLGLPSHDSAPTGPVSFYTARTAAIQAAGGYSGATWTPVEAAGFVPPKASFLSGPGPAPNYTNYPGNISSGPISPPPPTTCWWQAIGGSNLSGFTVPAAPSDVGTGLASGWMFMFTDPGNGMLVVTVLDGVAALYVTIPGGNCTTTYGMEQFQSIATGVIDSTQASQVANAWGGSAFLANATSVNETLGVVGAITIPQYSYYPGGPIEYNGSGLPGVVSVGNYTIPASWSVSYSFGPQVWNASGLRGEFYAAMDATNGTVTSVSASMTNGIEPCMGCVYEGGGYTTGSSSGAPPPIALASAARP